MYTILLSLGAVLLVAAILALLVTVLVNAALSRNALTFSNVGESTHGHASITLTAENVFASRYLLGKRGSTALLVDVCGASDLPLGIVNDEPAALDPCAVAMLGGQNGTVFMVASEAIAADVDVYTAASGQTQDEPGIAGTYYKVGRSVKAAAGAAAVYEVLPCVPEKFIVGAVLRTDTAAHLAADLQVIFAAPAKVKILGA